MSSSGSFCRDEGRTTNLRPSRHKFHTGSFCQDPWNLPVIYPFNAPTVIPFVSLFWRKEGYQCGIFVITTSFQVPGNEIALHRPGALQRSLFL